MQVLVTAVLATWVAVCVALFRRLPGRVAATVAVLGGWALLPVAAYPGRVFGEPVGSGGTMHALAIPTGIVINKAIAIGLGCLAGAALFDGRSLTRWRPSRLDLPVVAWCLTPLASALSNGLPAAEGLAQVRYLALTWGVPYLMGRVYFGDNESLRGFATALVSFGLVAIPLCLLEIILSPFLYGLLYGPQPYQYEGMGRYVLYRPLLFFEHGNALGMGLATAAVAAVWLRESGRMPSVLAVPGGIAAVGLVATCLASQSMGACLLMLVVVVPVWMSGRPSFRPRPAHAAVGVAVLLLALTVATAEAGQGGGVRGTVRDFFAGAGKQSFNWRFARYEQHLVRVAERPVLGWGAADFSGAADRTFVNPVNLGLWMLTLGQYGVVGLVASTLALTLPVVEVVKWLPVRAWLNPSCSAVTLAAALLVINAADSLFNSVYLLPMLVAAGGVNSWSLRRYEGG